MSTSFYVLETRQEKHARSCEVCNKGMDEGYLFEEAAETFCSIVCTQRRFRPKEYVALLSDDRLFWTTWHDEEEGIT